MLLSQLLKNYVSFSSLPDITLSGLTLDSRQVQRGDLFFAVKGTHLNGENYVQDAIKRGAAAILVTATGKPEHIEWHGTIPMIHIAKLPTKLAKIAAEFFGFPAQSQRMIGVTGTNGKTSCTHYIAQVLQSLGHTCGVIGTLGCGFVDQLKETGLTTPDAISLQRILFDLKMQGSKVVALEVSSHSIDQGRVNDIAFDLAIFTNLSQDHLDYHGTMSAYAGVKRRFFEAWPIKYRIINADDAYGAEWLAAWPPHQEIFAYSTKQVKKHTKVAIYAENIRQTGQGIAAIVCTPWGRGELCLPLIGHFNLSNGLAVLAALGLYGLPFDDILKQMAHIKPVPGRMQTLGGDGYRPLVVVDYAHTPDALEKSLLALRSHTQGKLICVFGCGGDRDRAKRPLMGQMAEKYADVVVVTNDNPRSESPEAIAQEIIKGCVHPQQIKIILNRSQAIAESIQSAANKDCILIAGKGAERYQQIGDQKLPFEDIKQARDCLNTIPILPTEI